MMFDVGCLIVDVMGKKLRVASCKARVEELCQLAPRASHLASRKSNIKHQTSHIRRRGISLIEILISIFVLLFGLMGVVAVFPVGNHYVVEGEKHDLGSSLAQNAFEELVARGMLRPEAWLYADVPQGTGTPAVILPSGLFNIPLPANQTDPHPGHAFVLDPMGRAAGFTTGTAELEGFPLWDLTSNQETEALGMITEWDNAMWAANVIPGDTWPIRRVTLPQAGGVPLSTEVGETIFRLRDDLAVDQPEQDDHPSIQNWDIADLNSPQTPNDPTDDTLLRRQYKGDYSWLATIVPTSSEALDALQPESTTNGYGELRCDVSIVVFRRREVAPSATSERLIRAEMISSTEMVIYGATTAEVDAAVDEVRPGNWFAVTGVNQTTGDFMMKWYRILALDDETVSEMKANYDVQTETGDFELRFLMLDGPEWPSTPTGTGYTNLRAIIMPGVISVATHPLHMEDFSLWSQ